MLSRIAESLFWIGRYVDRAHNTARLLDLHFDVLLEDPWVDEPTANASLLQVMHCERLSTSPETISPSVRLGPARRLQRRSQGRIHVA